MTVGYVVKRYPRFSETFIVNEILAHEQAGLDIEVFSIRPCNDTHFQDRIAKIRAPLTQLASSRPKANLFWNKLRSSAAQFPNLWVILSREKHADVVTLQQSIALAEAIQERGIRHLHAHFATLPAAVARLASQLAGITYSLTAHAKDIFHESVENDDLNAKICDAAALITVSQFNVDHLSQRFPAQAEKIHRVYNGLDLDELPYVDPQSRSRTILAVGRLVEKKGFDDLIRACARLRDQRVDFCCRIVGGGEEERRLRDLIAENSLGDRVELTGPIPQGQLKSLIHQAAVVAAPCVVGKDGNRDGLPTVLLEAMALGTPCVSTPVTGIPEVIEHDKSGFLVPEREPEVLSIALERLMENGQLRCRFAGAARTLIDREFDSRITSQQIRMIFDGCQRTNTERSNGRSVRELAEPLR